jgi:hypothetical protein
LQGSIRVRAASDTSPEALPVTGREITLHHPLDGDNSRSSCTAGIGDPEGRRANLFGARGEQQAASYVGHRSPVEPND